MTDPINPTYHDEEMPRGISRVGPLAQWAGLAERRRLTYRRSVG